MYYTTIKEALSQSRIDKMRSATRHIVRELGFMQKGLAGTDLSPSAVHTIIELGYKTVSTASELGALLHLEKSSISRLLHQLEKAGLIHISPGLSDRRIRLLSLTQKGRELHSKVEAIGRRQFRSALAPLSPDDRAQIETGLQRLAKALGKENQTTPVIAKDLEIAQGYRPGIIAAVTHLHAIYYSRNYDFGALFERKVAIELSEFMGRHEKAVNTIVSVYRGETLLGSVSIDGEELGESTGHLRWFIVSPEAQGMGIGRLLMTKAMAFVDQNAFNQTRLWTFKGLDAARTLYEKHGFEIVHENPSKQWGTEVIEQEFVRKSPTL